MQHYNGAFERKMKMVMGDGSMRKMNHWLIIYPDILNISTYIYHLLRRTHMWTWVFCTTSWEASLQIRTFSAWLDLWWGQSSSPGVLNHDSQGEDSEEYPELHRDREESHFLIFQLGSCWFIWDKGRLFIFRNRSYSPSVLQFWKQCKSIYTIFVDVY